MHVRKRGEVMAWGMGYGLWAVPRGRCVFFVVACAIVPRGHGNTDTKIERQRDRETVERRWRRSGWRSLPAKNWRAGNVRRVVSLRKTIRLGFVSLHLWMPQVLSLSLNMCAYTYTGRDWDRNPKFLETSIWERGRGGSRSFQRSLTLRPPSP